MQLDALNNKFFIGKTPCDVLGCVKIYFPMNSM